MKVERANLTAGFMKRKVSRVVLIAAAALIAAGTLSAVLVARANPFAKAAAVQQRTARVTKGNLAISVTGSGAIQSSDRVELSPDVAGTVTRVHFKEGDTVKAGDVLFELDDSSALLNAEKIRNNIAQTQLTLDGNSGSLANLAVRAPFQGKVVDMQVKAGDTLQKNATLLTISDSSRLKTTVSFSTAAVQVLSIGEKVLVNIQELMQSVPGFVTDIAADSHTSDSGTEAYHVEVTLDNPGSLKSGMHVNVETGSQDDSQTSIDAGTLEYVNSEIVKSDAGGTVKSIKVKENQKVSAGELLMELENDELEVSTQTTDLKMQDLKAQLADAEKQLLEYRVVSPINGIIVSQEIKEGQSVKAGAALAIVSDPVNMEFAITIDELDIAKIQKGQKAAITVDALTDTTARPLSGEVTQIALEGSASNGVTTYPVTVKVNETDRLRVGMNANASIIINEKTDTLLLPLEAVQRMGKRSFVWVKGTGRNSGNTNPWSSGQNGNRTGSSVQGGNAGQTGGSNNPAGGRTQNRANGSLSGAAGRAYNSNLQYYANAVMKPVELGINNDSYIEIVSGLEEGEEVILPPLTTGTATNSRQTQGGFGGMGGLVPGGFGGGNANTRNQPGARGNTSGTRN